MAKEDIEIIIWQFSYHALYQLEAHISARDSARVYINVFTIFLKKFIISNDLCQGWQTIKPARNNNSVVYIQATDGLNL